MTDPEDQPNDIQAMRDLFGRQLRARRVTAGLSRADVAARSGLSLRYVGVVERGRANPVVDTMVALADAVGAEVAELLEP